MNKYEIKVYVDGANSITRRENSPKDLTSLLLSYSEMFRSNNKSITIGNNKNGQLIPVNRIILIDIKLISIEEK